MSSTQTIRWYSFTSPVGLELQLFNGTHWVRPLNGTGGNAFLGMVGVTGSSFNWTLPSSLQRFVQLPMRVQVASGETVRFSGAFNVAG